jgi:tripartite motif-containing protein 71
LTRGMVLLVIFCLIPLSFHETQPVPPPSPLEYLGEWGVKGDGPGQLSRPAWLATDVAGNVYIADAGSRFVHKFNPQGGPLLSFQDDRLKTPTCIAVDHGGAIYVTDRERGSILVFLPEGKRLREIRPRPGGQAQVPVSVAVDDEGSIFVVEQKSNQIEKFHPSSRLIKAWGPRDASGEMILPGTIALGPDGFLYALDISGSRVQKFTRDGEFVAGWGEAGTASQAEYSAEAGSGIAVSEKYVFLADASNQGVRVWTLDGRPKLVDDLGGRLRSDTLSLFRMSWSPRGELLVLDFRGARVLRFRINF